MAITKSTPAPLTGGTLWCVTIALSLATFMQMLDSTISNVAIPTISGFLGASTDEGTWVITSFGVANAIAIPVTGRLAQRIGELRLFLLSVTFFSLSSLMCSLSTNLDVLIFFRVVQGLMAGPLIPLSQSLLLRNYPPEKRTFALALWSMTVIIAPICGPILGGYICDNFSWGWIFLINVPMGIVVLTLCLTLLKGRETETSPVKMNLPGLTLLVLGVGGLQIMLDKGRDLDWFNSSTIIILTVVSVISLISLVIWESTSENPILDLSLFKSRTLRKYQQANAVYADEAAKLKNTRLKNVLMKGDLTPEVVNNMLFSKNKSEIKTLYNSVGRVGRAQMRNGIIGKAMEKSGGSPDQFLRQLNILQNQTGITFKGQEAAYLKGLKNYLQSTQQAAKAAVTTPTGQQTIPFIIGYGTAMNPATTGAAVSYGLLTRAYESEPFRNAMLRMANTPRGSTAFEKAMQQAQKAINALTQGAKSDALSE